MKFMKSRSLFLGGATSKENAMSQFESSTKLASMLIIHRFIFSFSCAPSGLICIHQNGKHHVQEEQVNDNNLTFLIIVCKETRLTSFQPDLSDPTSSLYMMFSYDSARVNSCAQFAIHEYTYSNPCPWTSIGYRLHYGPLIYNFFAHPSPSSKAKMQRTKAKCQQGPGPRRPSDPW